jgi:hypothetical protein
MISEDSDRVMVKYRRDEPCPLASYASYELDGNDYDVGALEAAERTGVRTREAFGRLMQVLADKGILNAADISFILHDYVHHDLTLVRSEHEGEEVE